MRTLFSDAFVESLNRHAALKKAVQRKVDMIISQPVGLGEPLKGNFRGYYSCPVKKNFLIIYLYCRICRRRKDDGIVGCRDCADCPDETIRFVALGPQDRAYGKA
jgi:mRNA-degrading endonuclease YafQ of YafQ-DinJ toxin-antitoxin module